MTDQADGKPQASADIESEGQELSEAELDEVKGGNWPTNQTPASDPADTPSARAGMGGFGDF